MSKFLDQLTFFRKRVGTFSGDLGEVTREDRTWEDGYRNRWSHDKKVRSTHGVNCTGSCSWEVYVKDGLIVWEAQAVDYPQNRPGVPNHEPRGCPRGASASWYVYSTARIRHPLIRRRLVELWREARTTLGPVDAWNAIVSDPVRAKSYKEVRGCGGFVRVTWSEAEELMAAATVHTIETRGPDRIAGFSPIPAFSMVSYGAGTRFLSLIGGTCLSFYDWYSDLPPSSPMTWGEQTDVPESAAWHQAAFLLIWGSNVPQTRTPDAHFMTGARYRGAKTVVISPDFNEAAKFADLWVRPRQRTDAALALAMGHVILKEFFVDRTVPYFEEYIRRFSDLPMLVRMDPHEGGFLPGRLLRAADFGDDLGQENHPEWKTVGLDATTGEPVLPMGSIGFRWGETGKWRLDEHDGRDGRPAQLRLTLVGADHEVAPVGFPDFGGAAGSEASLLRRNVPVKRLTLRDGEGLVATVYDLLLANYGIDRGLGGDHVAAGYDDPVPCTPAWQERLTGVPRGVVVEVAREFATSAEQTGGRSQVIIGLGLNQAYHTDTSYRAVINLLVLCGCIGREGGGWGHYVGQEKIRPLTGWGVYSFASDWVRPTRQMNSTSYFYAHTDQFRYETVHPDEMLSPAADRERFTGSLIDYNVRAERMGWLPSSPQLNMNPLRVADRAAAAGLEPAAWVARALKNGEVRLACEDPDAPENFPRVLFVWRANLLGSSGKGCEYFMRHLLGAPSGVNGDDLAARGGTLPQEVTWRPEAPVGKLDLLVTADFRMSSTALAADVVLPAATWYEKDDLNSTDMHTFIHPFGAAVDPAWEARTDFEIFKGLTAAVEAAAKGRLGVEQDVVLTPLGHDTPAELGQALEVRDWKRGECEPVPGKTMPAVTVVERDYGTLLAKFTSLGPLVESLGVGQKGIHWKAGAEIADLGARNGLVSTGVAQGRPRLEQAHQAAEAILALSPETNGEVAVRAWKALIPATGIDASGLSASRQDERIRFPDLAIQPRRTITSPIWSGIEAPHTAYTAFWTNVNKGIPWRTISGRQQLYQDHPWMRAFGEAFAGWRPPLDTRSLAGMKKPPVPGERCLVLNFLTPHQKWSIHSSYTETLLMQTLSRGGPVIWFNEEEARSIGIADNDWVEAANTNGAVVARAIVSQRVMPGTCMMYHAQEKAVSTPVSPTTGRRGIHNSVTRVTPKPTHMIGGYAQLAYGFNYYGTIGTNRDEVTVIRKLDSVSWLEEAS